MITDLERAADLYRECLREFGVEPKAVNTRARETAFARYCFVSILYQCEGEPTLSEIGKFMANFTGRKTKYDHASVLSMKRNAKTLLLALDAAGRDFTYKHNRVKEKFVFGGPITARRIYAPMKNPMG